MYVSSPILKWLIIAILLLPAGFVPSPAQGRSETYLQTRKLLLKMERSSGSEDLKKLFEEADVRMQDLIQALNDPEEKVNLNSQVILKYLAAPEGLNAIEEWYKARQAQKKDYWMPKMKLLSEVRYLNGEDSDLAKLVLKNLSLFEAGIWKSNEISARLIARNDKYKTALIEVIVGEVFTAGWHVVIREEGDKWRLVSDNNVWVH